MRRAATRRRVLSAGAGTALGLTGAAVLAACGETQVATKEVPVEKTVVEQVEVEKIVTRTEIKEVPVEKVVVQEKIVTVEVEKPPERKTATIEFHHDQTSGTRGAAMKWALDRFAKEFPHINVKFVPQLAAFTETFNIKIVAGTQGELALCRDGSHGFGSRAARLLRSTMSWPSTTRGTQRACTPSRTSSP